jgi:NTP pyrophosphatase (non-canonical NTP hydrolase)
VSNVLTISELQEQVNKWHTRNFPRQTIAINQVVLTEEVGELSRAIAKMHAGIRGSEEEWITEARKEIGDVMISLMSVATSLGIDAEQAVSEKWASVSQRDWTANRIQHGIEVA